MSLVLCTTTFAIPPADIDRFRPRFTAQTVPRSWLPGCTAPAQHPRSSLQSHHLREPRRMRDHLSKTGRTSVGHTSPTPRRIQIPPTASHNKGKPAAARKKAGRRAMDVIVTAHPDVEENRSATPTRRPTRGRTQTAPSRPDVVGRHPPALLLPAAETAHTPVPRHLAPATRGLDAPSNPRCCRSHAQPLVWPEVLPTQQQQYQPVPAQTPVAEQAEYRSSDMFSGSRLDAAANTPVPAAEAFFPQPRYTGDIFSGARLEAAAGTPFPRQPLMQQPTPPSTLRPGLHRPPPIITKSQPLPRPLQAVTPAPSSQRDDFHTPAHPYHQQPPPHPYSEPQHQPPVQNQPTYLSQCPTDASLSREMDRLAALTQRIIASVAETRAAAGEARFVGRWRSGLEGCLPRQGWGGRGWSRWGCAETRWGCGGGGGWAGSG